MDRRQKMLRMRLESAVRTAVACTIVGCTTLYGPSHFQNHVPFPSFSYVTAILIVSDSTLGDTIRGSWHAFCATVQVVPISILSLWIFGPASFSPATAAMAVVVMSFLVGVPRSTDLLCKRIGFGQVVIVYVGAVAYGDAPGAVLRPLHLASSTGLGALASVIATFLPFPRLAISEVRKLFQLYTQNASARTSLFIKAFLSQDNPSAAEAICQSKPYNETGDKLLQNIKIIQEGLPWERHVRDLRCHPNIPGYQLQDIEAAIRGMEMALISCPLFPVSVIDQELNRSLQGMDIQLGLKLGEAPGHLSKEAITILDTKNEYFNKAIQSLAKFSPTEEQLPTTFLLFCMGFLFDSTSGNSRISNTIESKASQGLSTDRLQRVLGILKMLPSIEDLLFAFKCSISLGLAVLFGMLFNQQNAYWSGLTIAISFGTGVQPTFTVANARAQGTAMGTAYGVVGCFLFPNSREIRFLTLLPWIIFVGFLRHSRMYGQAGGISAVIGALLILGRQRYGPPHEFAITRLTEAFVGLACLILVELVVQRARAATLAKYQLSRSLRALEECIQNIFFPSHQQDMSGSLSTQELKEKQRTLKSHVNDLKELRKHAETEPNFYYLPFRGACYDKLLESLSKMMILLQLVTNILEALPHISNGLGDEWSDLEELIISDLQDFKEDVCTSLRYYEDITKIKSLAFRERAQKENKIFHDLEAGKLSNRSVQSSTNCEAAKNILSSYIQHSMQVVEKVCTSECEEDFKGKIVLYLGSLGFCMKNLMKETTAIENGIKELIRWENPLRHKLL
ncbi:ATP-dependent Clp protease proteolytic subunit-related protein 1, chloroplastic [Heracleum sosnowskyi]|uniref:ATP-dependent Clp protease proteolytic subunit-related protein 1, chloroplastic n=1 Tax=Heracleum sosnowskyi TaxID=360622 RepID=A0AAD8JG22_9APIA|nr:ATP-dependent Clp protease proteolytic subunit-related protein 1, chloroplastic [Heracleum sosnowskyi]